MGEFEECLKQKRIIPVEMDERPGGKGIGSREKRLGCLPREPQEQAV